MFENILEFSCSSNVILDALLNLMYCLWISMYEMCVFNFELQTLRTFEGKKFIISLLKKCYVHQLHLHQLYGLRITKNLDGHLLPDGGHISFGLIEGIPVRH